MMWVIHDRVWRPDGVVPKSNATRRSELRMKGIHIFDTYAGAIGGKWELCKLGFILTLACGFQESVFFSHQKVY